MYFTDAELEQQGNQLSEEESRSFQLGKGLMLKFL
jgi:hypothetical protein